MKPAPFNYQKVSSVAEAASLLREGGGDTKIIAGGQSLAPMMNLRAVSPTMLVDIGGINSLKVIEVKDGFLCIGAMACHTDVMQHPDVNRLVPLLTHAYKFVAHCTIRNRGTLGGNVAHADPASELPAVLQVLNARMRISDGREERVVSSNDFFIGMLETALDFADVLVAIEIPVSEGKRSWGFSETAARHGDYAYLAVAVTCDMSDGCIRDVRVAYAGLAEHAMRCGEVESILEGQRLTEELANRAGDAASVSLPVVGDHQVTSEHRKDLARVLTERALKMVAA